MMEEERQNTIRGADQSEGGDESLNELLRPIWAVVSFERCEATGVTYAEALQTVIELETRSVAGLCVVTADAAARIVREA